MYTIVEYASLLILAVVVSAFLFALSISLLAIEEAVRFMGKNSYKLATRLAHILKPLPTRRPTSEPLSSH
jgi:hypothetical protein